MSDTSSRTLILSIATEMNKTPQQMERFITVLEDNFLDTVESLKDLTDENYKDMGFPIGLVNKIKKRLSGEVSASAAQAQPVLTLQQPTTTIDTTGDAAENGEEEKSPIKVSEKARICLDTLQSSDIRESDPAEQKAKVKAVVSTLFKVISNILTSPFEPKFRKLPRAANSVQQKILANPSAVNFLKIAGFKFDVPGEHVVIQAYSKDELEACLLALKMFVERLGGQINDPMAFNPYKSGVSSTTGLSAVPKDAAVTAQAKILSQQEQINAILQEREAALEDRVEDREIQIYNQKANVASSAMNTNQFLAMMEQRQVEAAAIKEQEENKAAAGDQEMEDESQATTMINTGAQASVMQGSGGVMIGSKDAGKIAAILDEITDEDERRGALAFIADQEKKTKFRDRRAIQLDAVKRQAHHTRAKIRVKMPDGYILQATFGAKEKVQEVFNFVKDSIVHQDRPFYLFETPPKRVISNMKQTVNQARLVPSCLLYFGWSDLDETKMGDGPFIDMVKLRPHIVQL